VRRHPLLLVFLALMTACAPATAKLTTGTVPTITTTTATPTTTTTAAPGPAVTAAPKPSSTRLARPRIVAETGYSPFAATGGITLRHPTNSVERIGFHESNHEGAQVLEPLPTATRPTDLESRGRGTRGRTAADIVSDPIGEVRAPVSGKVLRAGTYVLYCKYSDDYVAIEPDEHPGWEVKLLHIDGVRVRAGDRVVAGQTVLAPRPTQLPFKSQVDDARDTDPAWPHVHVEVVDPSIPNVPSPGGGCS
jgi:biotin carboxyl carrier protein